MGASVSRPGAHFGWGITAGSWEIRDRIVGNYGEEGGKLEFGEDFIVQPGSLG